MPFLTDFQPQPDAPLYLQIYASVRSAILSGQLAPGSKLPSTRGLATELRVSRNTVLNAYEQLFSEGYLESVPGGGTFVTETLPEHYLRASSLVQVASAQPQQPIHRLSKRATDTIHTSRPTRPSAQEITQAFQAGMPALDLFPFELWSKLVARHNRRLYPASMMYQDPLGFRPLREAIAAHLSLARQVRCTPEQVLITSGSQGALDLAARVLLNPGDRVWMENPGYFGAKGALIAAEAKLIPVPIDADGLDVGAGIHRAPDARAAYVTPSHQFPMGVTLSLSRRLALLDWAKDAGAYIFEDDYDSEYRYVGRPLAALQGLDNAECVLYIGTFSKVLFPALRLGYIVLPQALIEPFLAFRHFVDSHPPIVEQMALADFIEAGHYARHIQQMRTIYAARRDHLLHVAAETPLQLGVSNGGMHVVAWMPDGISDQAFAVRARAAGVRTVPVSRLEIEPVRHALLLGYAAIREEAITPAIRTLGAIQAGWDQR